MPTRRFPPPWTAEVTPNCFIVRDASGQQVASVYYECEPGRLSAAKLLSKDEARRIAANESSPGLCLARVIRSGKCFHSSQHLTGELLQRRAGIKLLMVPYTGGELAPAALVRVTF